MSWDEALDGARVPRVTVARAKAHAMYLRDTMGDPRVVRKAKPQ
jgi:hypothetical protein